MKLSNTDNYVIERIKENVDFFVENSLTLVSQKYNVSESTLIRLARKLNYSSIKQMKIDYIKKYYLNSLLEIKNDNNIEGNDILDIINNNAALSIYSIYNTNKNMDLDILKNVVNKILSIRKISIFGVGNSFLAAEFLSKQLNRVGLKNSVGNSYHHAAVQVTFIEEQEIFIIFSRSGKTLECIEIAQLAKEKNIILVLITGNFSNENRLLEFADYTLFYSNHKHELYNFPNSSYIGQIFVSTTLFNLILNGVENLNEKLSNAETYTDKWNK